ncbi:hypothetical protein [Metapseudomonas boanensis]|uniref:Uncharacterized protein n=1 Tax=Metapseudomonas boanensis TaxID=2822138 RepID=A0ABS5XLZ6_9GAMM|nr:hypothetical protein [Pseudomonas boanensis]MBT8768719.1 hypothetical protein [Pseudomonas boanensis]
MTEFCRKRWEAWVSEIRITWVLVLLLTVVPAVLFGTAILSMMVLIGVVLLGIPTALAAFLVIKDKAWCARLCRRVVVMMVVSALAVVAVLKTDKLTPGMASPIAKAIEDFKQENGGYPETLAALSPKHLPRLPAVRIAVFQPEVIYRVREGRPYLAVPSAAGDSFSKYEYSFEDQRWVHYD